MKKIIIMTIIIIFASFGNKNTKADSDYKSFEEISFTNEGKFLKDYSKADYKSYYKNVLKRKFIGWNTYEVTESEKVEYVVETLFSFYNDGYSPIKYKMSYGEKVTTKKSISTSGSLGVSGSGNKKIFKGGLDAKLKTDNESSNEEVITESFDIDVDIDEGTILNIYTKGEGKITNGVAARYIFWFMNKKGGYEIFISTTQTYRMEKIKL